MGKWGASTHPQEKEERRRKKDIIQFNNEIHNCVGISIKDIRGYMKKGYSYYISQIYV